MVESPAQAWVGDHRGVGAVLSAADPALRRDLDDPVWQRGLGLLETMLGLSTDGVPRLPLAARHLARLRLSARALAAPCPEDALFARLPELVAAVRGATALRIRLVFGLDGRVLVTAAPLVEDRSVTSLAVVSARRDPADPTCALKTTSRMFFEVAQREATAAGAEQALICSRSADGVDQVAECSWSNLFLATAEGELLTPAADGSLLPGVARAALLGAARFAGQPITETRLTPSDLRRPGALLVVTNAVRGPRLARLVGEQAPPDLAPSPAAQAAAARLVGWWRDLLTAPA